MVLATHWGASKILPVSIPFGNMGVNLFFVISGFLITCILLDLKEDRDAQKASFFQLLKTFYIRRSLRIFPIYYLTILICLVLGVQPIYEIWGWLVTYSLNLGVSFAGTEAGVFLPFWSLAVEEQFYLFFPLLILIVPKKYLPKLFWVMIITAVIARFIFNRSGIYEFREGIISYQFTLCCLDTFGLGALLAYFYQNSPNQLASFIQKYFWIAAIFLILFFVVEFSVKGFSGGTTLGRLFFAVACAGVIAKASVNEGFGGITKFVLENPISLYIGKISYGIYVYHNFVGESVADYVSNQYLRLFLRLIITLFIASVSWHFFELPINRLKEKFKYKENKLIKII